MSTSFPDADNAENQSRDVSTSGASLDRRAVFAATRIPGANMQELRKRLPKLSSMHTDKTTTHRTFTEGLSFQLQFVHFVNEALFTTPTVVSLAIYSGITAAILYVDALESSGIIEYLNASKVAVGFFSSFLGFSLVFRTNICYNRWWEGRCLWGALIFASINLAQQGQCWIKDKENLRRLCCAVISFTYACKAQLRGASIQDDSDYLLQNGLLNATQLDTVTKRNGWEPYYFLGAMRAAINNDLEKSRVANRDNYSYKGSTTESQILIFEESLRTLATSIGGLIRVKSTGLPIAYDLLFNIVFNIFFVIATLAWAPSLGWYTPILVGVLNFVVRLIIVIGSELEDPFGDDVTDLPLQKFLSAIETQIEAIFDDAFPADLIGGQWPISQSLGAASSEDTTTPNNTSVPSCRLSDLMGGSTAKARYEHKSRRKQFVGGEESQRSLGQGQGVISHGNLSHRNTSQRSTSKSNINQLDIKDMGTYFSDISEV